MPRRPGPIERSSSKSSRNDRAPRRTGADALNPETSHSPEATTIVIGTIVRPHGVHGAILVRGPGSVCEALRAGLAVRVEPRGSSERTLDAVIHHSRAHRKGAIVELACIGDRDAAALLVGRSLTTRRSELPAAGAGEYYACDVIGVSAYSTAGERLGVIREIVSTGANDVWVVSDGARELLIPAVAHAVIEVDLAQGRIVVEPAAASRSNER